MRLGKFAEGGEGTRASRKPVERLSKQFCAVALAHRTPSARVGAARRENQYCVVRSQYCRNRVGPATMSVAWRAARSVAYTLRASLERATHKVRLGC